MSSTLILEGLLEMLRYPENKYPHITYQVCILMSLAYEKSSRFELSDKCLQKADYLFEKFNLEEWYSYYCVRKSSFFRFVGNYDSAYHYALIAEEMAKKYSRELDLEHAYFLQSIYHSTNKDYDKSLDLRKKILDMTFLRGDSLGFVINLINVSGNYLKLGHTDSAILFNDSAQIYKDVLTPMYRPGILRVRYQIYEQIGLWDSALYYHKLYMESELASVANEESIKIEKIERQYQSNSQNLIIRNQNLLLIFSTALLFVIILAVVLVMWKNGQINFKNKVISLQVDDLSQALHQKKFLLKELQHRVKNNLQHVISILEIQKESADFNNIDELVRGNQNRIQSMAVLHE